jgi:uncharacterized protein YabE (DUF348 family)
MNILRLVGWLLIVSALVIAGVAAWTWIQPYEYTVIVDEETQTIQGKFEDVSELLSSAGVEVGPYDILNPPMTALIGDGDTVKIERARNVEVHTDGGSEVYWTHLDLLAPFLIENGIEVGPSDDIQVGGLHVAFESVDTALLADEITLSKVKKIEITDNGSSQIINTDAETVGQLLDEVGITLFETDVVAPPQEAWLIPDTQINITRTSPVIIAVDGNQVSLRTNFTRTVDILDEVGVQLGDLDYSIPGPDFGVKPGNIIRIVRVTEELYFEDEPIPYDSVFQGTDTLELDQRALLVQGEPGILRRQIRARYEDGAEVSRSVDSEWIEKEAVNEVNGFGTRIVIRALDTPEGSYEFWRVVRMRVTAYTASSSGKPPDHPAYGVTASGVSAGTGVVAIDPKVVPFRSWVFVPGYGIGYAGDTGGGVKGRWIDLGYDEEELVAWSSYTDVYYLTPVPPTEKINYLIPTALP